MLLVHTDSRMGTTNKYLWGVGMGQEQLHLPYKDDLIWVPITAIAFMISGLPGLGVSIPFKWKSAGTMARTSRPGFHRS